MGKLSGELGDYSEAWLSAQVKAYLESLKPRLWFYKATDLFNIGLPDIIGVYNGYFFAIELKAKGKTASKLQLYVIRRIHNAGGRAIVSDNLYEIQEFIDSIPA